VGGRPGPYARALERRRDLHHVPLADPELHLAGVGDHLDRIPVRALIARLRHQRLKPGPDLAGRQVPGRRDELNPQTHAPLAAVAQLEHRAPGQRPVVDEVEHAHLVQVEHDLELGG